MTLSPELSTEEAIQDLSKTLELDHVESHLHPEGSFVVDDHVVPTGMEEIWRFTPLKRLRGLHQDTPLDGEVVTVQRGVFMQPPESLERREPPDLLQAEGHGVVVDHEGPLWVQVGFDVLELQRVLDCIGTDELR